MKTDNKIYVNIYKNNTAILKFPDYNIETIAHIGENGVTTNKKEGDGKTPIGEFDLGLAFGMHSEEEFINETKLEYQKISNNLYWIDDPKSKYYNKLIDFTKVSKDWNSSEHLIQFPNQYEYAIEIKVNPNNLKNKGSAVFLHCIKNDYTKGCIAIEKDIMKKIIELANSKTKIEIVKVD